MATTTEVPHITFSSSPHQPLLSSSPLPSPTAILRRISKAHVDARQTKPATTTTTTGKVDIWEILDSQDEGGMSPAPKPQTRKKPIKPAGSDPAAKPPRNTRAKQRSRVLEPKTINEDVRAGTKSKHFAHELEGVEKPVRKITARKMTSGAPTIATTSKQPWKKVESKGKAEVAGEPKISKPDLLVIPTSLVAQINSSPLKRRQWTPTRNSIATTIDISPETNDTELAPIVSFGEKIGDLAYRSESSREDRSFTDTQAEANLVLTRKRRIEMIGQPNPKAKEATPKSKKPRKKARASKDAPPGLAITGFFSASKKTTGGPTRAKPATKRKREDEEEPISLLSPTSAKKRIDSQDFAFGTCSQFEREHIVDDDYYALTSPASPADNIPNSPRFDISKGLWVAANRDLDGGLLGRSDLNAVLPDTQETPSTVPEPTQSHSSPEPDRIQPVDEYTDINSVIPLQPKPKPMMIDLTISSPAAPPVPENTLAIFHTAKPRVARPISTPPIAPSLPLNALSPTKASTRALSTIAASDVVRKRRTASVTPPSLPPPAKSFAQPPQQSLDVPKMPDFSSYLTSRLQSELSGFGFKKIGSKAAMIATIEKCWLAQNSSAQPQQKEEADSMPEPAKRKPRARSASAKPRSRASSKEPDAAPKTRTRKRPQEEEADSEPEPAKRKSRARSASAKPRSRPPPKEPDAAPKTRTRKKAQEEEEEEEDSEPEPAERKSRARSASVKPRSRASSKEPDAAPKTRTRKKLQEEKEEANSEPEPAKRKSCARSASAKPRSRSSSKEPDAAPKTRTRKKPQEEKEDDSEPLAIKATKRKPRAISTTAKPRGRTASKEPQEEERESGAPATKLIKRKARARSTTAKPRGRTASKEPQEEERESGAPATKLIKRKARARSTSAKPQQEEEGENEPPVVKPVKPKARARSTSPKSRGRAASKEPQEQEKDSKPATPNRSRRKARANSRSPKPKSRGRAASKGHNTKTRTRHKTQHDRETLRELYTKISEAVKHTGKPGDINSFHHRILMYDPIIVEDLTAWLNTKGLDNVGFSGEAGMVDVRAWCDMNGVCCLSKETHRGMERKRF